MFYPISTTPTQFKWLADQLRASRAVIEASQKISVSLFGNRLANMAHLFTGEPLCSAVNIGMLGFPITSLTEEKWKTHFQYRHTAVRGIAQFPNGDLYLSPINKSGGRLACLDLPLLDDYPITSLMFRLDMADRTSPRWWVEPHQNTRPNRPKQSRPGSGYAKAL